MRHSSSEHRTIFACDVAGFGGRTQADYVVVRQRLHEVIRQAFDDAGVDLDRCLWEDRGDGVLVLVPAEVPKILLTDMLPGQLVVQLRRHNATHEPSQELRLRMVLHAGEVERFEDAVVGSSIVHAYRILDASAVKRTLAESQAVLALAASEWFFDDVIKWAPDADPEFYQRIRVENKETIATAWLRVWGTERPEVLVRNQLAIPRQPLCPWQEPGDADHYAGVGDASRAFNDFTANLDLAKLDRLGQMVLVTGDRGTGKTSLINRCVHWFRTELGRSAVKTAILDLTSAFDPDRAIPIQQRIARVAQKLGRELQVQNLASPAELDAVTDPHALIRMLGPALVPDTVLLLLLPRVELAEEVLRYAELAGPRVVVLVESASLDSLAIARIHQEVDHQVPIVSARLGPLEPADVRAFIMDRIGRPASAGIHALISTDELDRLALSGRSIAFWQRFMSAVYDEASRTEPDKEISYEAVTGALFRQSFVASRPEVGP